MEKISSCSKSICLRRNLLGSLRSIGSLTSSSSPSTVLPSTRSGETGSSASPPTSPNCFRARHTHSAATSADASSYARLARRRLSPSFVRSYSYDGIGSHGEPLLASVDTLHDLKTFLTKVGTDSKEARYWLKHFQESTALGSSPFAVVFIPALLMRDAHSVNAISETMAFLQRNNMRAVMVHGVRPRKLMRELKENNRMAYGEMNFSNTPWAKLRAAQQLLDSNSMYLIDALSKSHAFAQIVPSTSVFYVDSSYQGSDSGPNDNTNMCTVDSELLRWCLKSGNIPVVSAMAQSADGRVVHLEPFDAVASLVRTLQPRKVILLNQTGALINMTTGSKVSEVNSPGDNASLLGQPWCQGRLKEKLQRILNMLESLPENGSVTLTSPMTILRELFTHHGDGTIFQKRDRVLVHNTLEGIDTHRLRSLLCTSFNSELDPAYFEKLKPKLNKIYLSERYSFAAIVTNEEGAEGVPYLDKFAVIGKSQGQGSSQALWDLLRRDFQTLFWRSYTANRFNEWYYPRCCGLQSVNKWKVFWYGFTDYQLSQKIVQAAGAMPESFIEKRPDVADELDMTRPSTWSSSPAASDQGTVESTKRQATGTNEEMVYKALEAI
eukprot:scpid49343/ scgid7170/ N-acetylglutamate synthase, mitochondrial; Amino-acid acetyltransferase; N-acetylglutamate synthase long form; N-acetylglutamate synthase short form; N-acetylglutamate synthase conserved domain form